MFKRFSALHVLLVVLVIAGLAFGGVMLYQSGFARGAVTQLPEGALEGFRTLPYTGGFHTQHFARPTFGVFPLLMGFSLFFRILFFVGVISLIAGLFRRAFWGRPWGHYPHHAYAGRGCRHPDEKGYGWYYGPIPPEEKQPRGDQETPENSESSDPE